MSMTRGSLLGQDPSRRGSYWHGLFACHGAHGAGACCALCVEAEFRHRGQPGHHASTCPLNRQGTAAAATHPRPCFSEGYSSTASCTPLQHLWGSKMHTQTCLHTRAHTRTHVHAHTRTHTYARAHTYKLKMRARIHTGARTHIHMHANKHTDTFASTHTPTQTHRHTCTHTYTHTCTHTCICMHMLCA